MNTNGVDNKNDNALKEQVNGTNQGVEKGDQNNLEHKDSTKSKKLTLKEKLKQKNLKKGSTSFQPNQQKTKPQAFQSQRHMTNTPINNQMNMNQQSYYQYPTTYGQNMQQPYYMAYSNTSTMNPQAFNNFNYRSAQTTPYNYAQNPQMYNNYAQQQYSQMYSQRNMQYPINYQQQQQYYQQQQAQQFKKTQYQTEQSTNKTENNDQQTKNIDIALPDKEQKKLQIETQEQKKPQEKQETVQVQQGQKTQNEQIEKQDEEKPQKDAGNLQDEKKETQIQVKEAVDNKVEELKQEEKVEKIDPNHISEEQIENFIENYAGKLSEEYQYLQFKIIEVEVAKGGKYNRNNKNQKGGNFEVNKPNKHKYKDRQQRDNQKKDQNAPQELARKKVSEETLKKIKEIKENASTWGYMKKNEDEQVQAVKKMKALLNKLTADNFSKVSVQILDCAKNEKIIDPMIENLVRKAWNEPRYTKCYAELVVVLTKQNFSWDKNKKNKSIRKKVLNKVEYEYVEGFQKYQDYAKKIQENKEYTPQEKKDLLSTKKKQLLGNINFICELYEQKVLNFKIFKMIILYGLYNFIKEYIRTENNPDTYSIKEDYLEALMKIFQNSGHTIQKNEIRQIKKKREENPKFEEDTQIRDEMFQDFKQMIKDNDDFTDDYMEKEDLDRKSSRIFKVSTLFFNFLKHMQGKKLSVRMDSLIQNLIEYKDSNYTQNIQKISAAKKLSDIQKDIQKQKQKDEEDIQNYYDDNNNNHYNESYKRDKNYQSFRKKGKYSKQQNDNEYYQKKTSDQYQKKQEMSIEEMKKSIKKFCEEDKQFTKETYTKFLDEKLGNNYQNILQVYFETFAYHLNKEQIPKKINYPIELLQDNRVTQQQFRQCLNKSFQSLYLESSELPFLLPCLIQIIFTAVQDNLLNFSNVILDQKPAFLEDEDHDEEEFIYFLKDLSEEAQKQRKNYNLPENDFLKWYNALKDN